MDQHPPQFNGDHLNAQEAAIFGDAELFRQLFEELVKQGKLPEGYNFIPISVLKGELTPKQANELRRGKSEGSLFLQGMTGSPDARLIFTEVDEVTGIAKVNPQIGRLNKETNTVAVDSDLTRTFYQKLQHSINKMKEREVPKEKWEMYIQEGKPLILETSITNEIERPLDPEREF